MKASRHGRYRKQLFAPPILQPLALQLAAVFDALDEKRVHGILRDDEFLGYGLLALLVCWRPDALQRHQSKNREHTAQEIAPLRFTLSGFWQLLCAQQLPIAHCKNLLDQDISLQQFLDQVRFRGIPDSAQTALVKWLQGEYPLRLLFHIPTAADVFELQKQGFRCISFLKGASDITAYHHDRDVISFIVHDLIHAHEFYALPQRAKQQIGFYHWLDTIKDNPLLLELQASSGEFLACWEYVLSDMNSYCGHLLKTLNASFTIHGPATQGVSPWESVVDASDLAPDEKHLFRKINSAAWCETDFLQLEAVFEKRSGYRDW